MTVSQRCMRFTTAALACNAVCLGFATGLAKAPSQGMPRTSSKSATMNIGGPLRGLAPAAVREQARRGLGAGARRILGTLRNGKGVIGEEEEEMLGASADGGVPSAKVWREKNMTKNICMLSYPIRLYVCNMSRGALAVVLTTDCTTVMRAYIVTRGWRYVLFCMRVLLLELSSLRWTDDYCCTHTGGSTYRLMIVALSLRPA